MSITVTETHYLDGTGEVFQDVEYKTANDFQVEAGDNKGDLKIYRTIQPTPGDEPKIELLAYYHVGSYSKLTKK